MPLYLWAARELLSEGEATALGATYLSIRDPKAREVLKFTDEAGRDEFLARFEKRLFEVAKAVRSGVFSPAPAGKCPQHCEARGVCRFNIARIEHLRGQDGHS